MSATDRPPRRLELETGYPRLVPPGQARGADVWQAHGRLILDAAGEGIYGLDVEGRSTFVNPAAARLTGHSVEELLGQRMHDIAHHSHADGSPYANHACPIYAAFKDGMIRNVQEEVFWRKDGTSFPVEYTSTPIYLDGKLAGAVLVFRDISLRSRPEERLRAALHEVQGLKDQLRLENESLRQQIESTRERSRLVGQNGGLRDTMRLVERIAATESTVLIQGETGTGKELITHDVDETIYLSDPILLMSPGPGAHRSGPGRGPRAAAPARRARREPALPGAPAHGARVLVRARQPNAGRRARRKQRGSRHAGGAHPRDAQQGRLLKEELS